MLIKDVITIIKDASTHVPSPYRWVILLIIWAALFIGVAAQFQIAGLAYEIFPKLKITPGQYSLILTAPMFAGVCFSFAAGALADRFGVKRVVAVGFVFSIVGVFFRYTAHTFWEMFFLMFLAGISTGLLNANVLKLLGAWFPKEQIGTAMGIYSTAMGVGTSVALATSALFPSSKSAFITAGIIMVLVWLIWMAFVRSKPKDAPDLPVMPVTEYMGVAARSKNVWLVGIALMFFMGSSMVFTGFLPNALTQARGMTPVTAGAMASLVTLGTIVGSLVGPHLANKVGRIKPFIMTGAVLGALAGYSSWVSPQGFEMSLLLALLGIFSGICSPLLMAYPMLLPEIGPEYAGSAGGIIGTLQVIGAVFIPSLIFAPIAGQNFNLLFTLASVTFLVVCVIVLFLPELGSKAMVKASATPS